MSVSKFFSILGRLIQKFRTNPQGTLEFLLHVVKNIFHKNTIRALYNEFSYTREYIYKNLLQESDINKVMDEIDHFTYKPKISIILPTYNSDLTFLESTIQSVKDQVYPHWELCIADDASTKPDIRPYLEQKMSEDDRIKVIFRETNGHISKASNTALSLATGEFIGLLDHDDVIYNNTLYEVVKFLNRNNKLDFIYTDRDNLSEDGSRINPFFKPYWSPDLLLSNNYLTHFNVIRKSLVDRVGGFREGFEGSQDYDLFLRVLEQTDKIGQITKVLYSWRMIKGSSAMVYSNKTYAHEAARKALQEALERRNLKGTVENGIMEISFRIHYELIDRPLVSIIIPTKDKVDFLIRCIDSILEKTTYENYEIIVVDTNSVEDTTRKYYEEIQNHPRIHIHYWEDEFNYSSVNNFGVDHASGEYFIFLNNDTEIVTPDWIEGMLEHAQHDHIGAVGVKLLYPDDTIQHAGIGIGLGGVAANLLALFPDNIKHYYKDVIKNTAAVTAACLMVSKKKFLEIGGFDASFKIAYNDVDLCLKLLEQGYLNLYTPHVIVYHYESTSIGKPGDKHRDVRLFNKEQKRFRDKWNKYLVDDPYYNPNFNKSKSNFTY